MKKIVVMSDNHGDDRALKRIFELEPDGDLYIHCGDSETRDEEKLAPFICVTGNNDWFLNLPVIQELKVEGVSILVTHGNRFGYVYRDQAMRSWMDDMEGTVRLLISGHTHIPEFWQDGMYIHFNPGSTSLPRGGSDPSYGVIYIDGDFVKAVIKPFSY